MAKFKNPKEWARFVLNELAEKTDDIKAFLDTEEGFEYLANIIYNIATDMYDEALYYIREQKRTHQATLKQLNDKSRAIAARIDTLTQGVVTVNPNFFICSIYVRCHDEEGRPLPSYYRDLEFAKFIRAIENCPEFISIINKLRADVREKEKQEKAMENFAPHICKPLEWYLDQPKYELMAEHMNCIAALGSYSQVGMVSYLGLESFRPLVNRANFMKYCYHSGGITKELIEEFKKDENAFLMKPEVQKVCNPFR